jgi:hypothetical protein
MPDWLQLRVAHCKLSFFDGTNEGCASYDPDIAVNHGPAKRITAMHVAGAAGASVSADGTQQPLASLLQCPALHSTGSSSNLRWQKLAPHSAVAPATANQPPLFAPGSQQGDTSNAPCCAQRTSDAAETSLAPLSSTVAADIAASISDESCKPSKKRKKQCMPCPNVLSSPPKMYKDDREYQRYLADSNDVSAWVRKTLLDR